MIICVIMQYLRTGLISNQNVGEAGNLYVWVIPPIVLIIGLLIGIVLALPSVHFVVHGL